MLKKQLIGVVLMMFAVVIDRSYAQTNEMENLFHNFEARAAAGTPGTVDEAEPVLDRLTKGSRESVAAALPLILHAASNPHLSVRRVAAMALWEITTRPDGQSLLSAETATFTALLTDSDIPIRRISILAVATLRPDASSPLVPVLENYLVREDAVSTIGAGAATVLMKAAPNDAESTNAVAQYMRRKDQTSASRDILLDAIVNVAKSHNREIGKEVAGYADDPSEQTSVKAIGTLQSMGKDVVLDSQQSLSRIAADTTSSTPNVRAAARRALTAAQ
jgi:hypothetical protein